MNILITSGGTKVPIDQVRNISNMSSGTFGSKIAKSFLEKGDDVTFFCAENSKTPFRLSIDLHSNEIDNDLIKKNIEFAQKYKAFYSQIEYKTYDDYRIGLYNIIEDKVYDAIILVAAVSDYKAIGKGDKKISGPDSLKIELVKLPKIISEVKKISPSSKLIGFKLLADATYSDMMSAMKKSMKDNECDIVIGNDLESIKAGNHEIKILTKNTMLSFSRPHDVLEDEVVNSVHGLFV